MGAFAAHQLWVEPVADLIIARVRGVPTADMLQECQERVLVLARESGRTRVLCDALEMEPPAVEVALLQRKLDEEIVIPCLKRAILVPSARLAYLARLAFGEGNYRVFYSDIRAAVQWLGA